MRVSILALALMTFSAPAFAVDEFGARFNDKAPAALEDTSVEPMIAQEEIKALQDIMPAAGEETPAVPDAASPETAPALSENPANALLKAEPAAGEQSAATPEANAPKELLPVDAHKASETSPIVK